MTSKPKAARRAKSNHRPFFDLLDQIEETLRKDGADWPVEITAEARRRLTRLERAVRLAPQRDELEW